MQKQRDNEAKDVCNQKVPVPLFLKPSNILDLHVFLLFAGLSMSVEAQGRN